MNKTVSIAIPGLPNGFLTVANTGVTGWKKT